MDPWLLVRIRTRGSVPLTNGSGSCYFRPWPLRCQQKTILFLCFSAYYLLKVHLHYFSKIKSHKEVTKHKVSRFFLLFLLDDRRIHIRSQSRIRTSDITDPDQTSQNWFFTNKECKFCGHRSTQPPPSHSQKKLKISTNLYNFKSESCKKTAVRFGQWLMLLIRYLEEEPVAPVWIVGGQLQGARQDLLGVARVALLLVHPTHKVFWGGVEPKWFFSDPNPTLDYFGSISRSGYCMNFLWYFLLAFYSWTYDKLL